jgi:hypothetical protein
MLGYEYRNVGGCPTCGRPIVSPIAWNGKGGIPTYRTCLHSPGSRHVNDDVVDAFKIPDKKVKLRKGKTTEGLE